jgi:hypothetical protein
LEELRKIIRDENKMRDAFEQEWNKLSKR